MTTDKTLTVEALEEAITAALKERDEDIKETLMRLHQTDLEAEQVMRELLTELREVQSRAPTVDPDVVAMLRKAARDLRDLPDYAATLLRAAKQLK